MLDAQNIQNGASTILSFFLFLAKSHASANLILLRHIFLIKGKPSQESQHLPIQKDETPTISIFTVYEQVTFNGNLIAD